MYILIYRATCISIQLSIYVWIYLFIYLPIYLPISLSLSIYIYLSICLSACLPFCLSVCLSVCLSISVSMYLARASKSKQEPTKASKSKQEWTRPDQRTPKKHSAQPFYCELGCKRGPEGHKHRVTIHFDVTLDSLGRPRAPQSSSETTPGAPRRAPRHLLGTM